MIPIDQEQVRLLERRLRGIGVDRRSFLKVAAAAVSGPAAMSLLAACGGDDDDDDDDGGQDAPTAAEEAPTATTAEEEPTEAEEEEAPTEAEEEATEAEEEPTEAEEEATEGESGSGTADPDQTFYDIYLTSDPASHDYNADLYCGGVANLWSGMATFDADFQMVPDWAESWEPNEDASVWTYNIRPDNTGFSNGDPVTAEVFAWSWKRLVTPETAAPYASLAFDIVNAEDININGMDPEELGVTVIDDWTLEVQMVGPRGVFPVVAAYIAMVPAHQPSVEANPDAWTDPNQVDEVVSNGPFKMVAWEHDVMVTVEKNENHWNAENIQLQTVVLPIIPAQQGLLPYEAGDVDWALVPGPDLTRVRDDPQMSTELVRYVYPGIWFLLPQVTIAPFDQLEVRTALSHSIDRQRIVDVTNGQGQPAQCLMPPGLFGFMDDDEITSIQPFDPDLAMEALVGTDFEGGQNWPEIVLTLREEQHNSQIMAEDIAAQMTENLGMEVAVNIMESRTFRDAMWNLELQLNFIRWFYDYPDPNNGYFDMFYSNKETGKRQAWSNEEFDQLTIAAKEATEPADRLDLYHQCEVLMQTDRAYIPATYRVSFYVFKPWVKGIPVNQQGFVVPDGNMYVRMWSSLYIEGREV